MQPTADEHDDDGKDRSPARREDGRAVEDIDEPGSSVQATDTGLVDPSTDSPDDLEDDEDEDEDEERDERAP